MDISKIIFLIIGYGGLILIYLQEDWYTRLKIILAMYFIALMKTGAEHSIFFVLFGILSPKYSIKGYVKPGYEKVKNQFEQNFKDGVEKASQCCIFVKGEKVVDLYGTTNRLKEPYNDRTIQLIYSSCKSINTLAIAILVERGLLNYEQKISSVWPEFGQNGKENITLEQLLRHESGLHKLKEEIHQGNAQLHQIKEGRMAKMIEESRPQDIGQRFYHSASRGQILCEIVRRVDPQRRTIGEFIQEEICRPLGVEYYTGIPEEKLKEIQQSYFMIIENPFWLFMQSLVPNKLKKLVVVNCVQALFFYIFTVLFMLGSKIRMASKEYKTAEMPSMNGASNAYSMAKIAALLSQGGKFENVELFSKGTNQQFHHQPIVKTDMMFRKKNKFNRGGNNVYTSDQDAGVFEDSYGFIGWQGFGGSLINWHQELEIGFGYAMNLCDPDGSNLKGLKIRKVAYECAYKLK